MSTPAGGVRLACPLCHAVVSDGPEPVPGTCPGCGAVYGGGGDTPPQAASSFLEQQGLAGISAEGLARGLFEIDADGELGRRVAVTSDERQAFYRWWLFALPGQGEALGTLLSRVPGSV